MGRISKLSNGVFYFDGYTSIDDPYKSQVSTLNGLTAGYSNKAIVGPNGQIILVNPQPGEVGTLGYTTLRGPSEIRFDLDMVKRFRIHESKEFEFRIDAINVLNHPVFSIPTGLNSASFTSINSTTFGNINSATGSRSFVITTRVNF